MVKAANKGRRAYLVKPSTTIGIGSLESQKTKTKNLIHLGTSDTDDALDAIKAAEIMANILERNVVILDNLKIVSASSAVPPQRILEVVRFQEQDIHDVGPMW